MAQQPPCSAATFRAAATFAILTILAVTHTLHTQMRAEHVPRSLAAQHYTYKETALAALMKQEDPAAFTSVTNAMSPSLPKPHHPSRPPIPLTMLAMLINPHQPMPACP